MDYLRYEQQAMRAGAEGDFVEMGAKIELARDSWYDGFEVMEEFVDE